MYYLLLTLFFLMSTSPAYCAAITNLSKEPQSVSFREWKGETTVNILPGRTLRIPGDVTFRYQERELRIEDNEEYAIWETGIIGPQRRLKRHSF
jgi:hypothetical protein